MSEIREKNKFGTFGGVFTPSMLTILGLIMFMRSNQVVGVAGILPSLLILSVSCSITFLTGLSISGISSNTPVKGGGAYFLISRVLGPTFGAAIGIALYLAQAISVPFYILGFVEAVVATFPAAENVFLPLCVAVLVALFLLVWSGAGWAIKVQYGILAVLGCAIAAFLLGALNVFEIRHFAANLYSDYGEGQDFWRMFALYFPAVTGIMAGVNMSGDLKNPERSIPLGTLLAIVVGFVVYALQMIVCGGMAPRGELIANPYTILVDNALFGFGWLVTAGVFLATLSSAIGSDMGAPRVLQGVARDRVIRILNIFGKGTRHGDEPRRALVATFCLGLVVLLVFGRGESGAGLNVVAGVITMIFLYTYGMTNLAAFVERFGRNPSFRPRFRLFHWSTALAGAAACIWAAFMINYLTAILALAFIAVIFAVVSKREMTESFGDARRGFVYTRVARNLQHLAELPLHPKNWRPTVLVLSGNPHQRGTLVRCASLLGQRHGIVSVLNVVPRVKDTPSAHVRRQTLRQLEDFCRDEAPGVFPEAIVVNDFDQDLDIVLQSYSIGPLKPNLVLAGWPQNRNRLEPYFNHLRTIIDLERSLVVYVNGGTDPTAPSGRVDIWWRGQKNGSLMLILGHLLLLNPEWRDGSMRILRQVGDHAEAAAARHDIVAMLKQARIEADTAEPVSSAPFAEVFRQHSRDAALVLLGLNRIPESVQESFFDSMDSMLNGMPPTLLIHSSGEADFTA